MLKLLSLALLLSLAACGHPLEEAAPVEVERYPERGRLAPSLPEPAQVEAPNPPTPKRLEMGLDAGYWEVSGDGWTSSDKGAIKISAMPNATTCAEYAKGQGAAAYNWKHATIWSARVEVPEYAAGGELVPVVDFDAETSPVAEVGDCREPSKVVFEWNDGSGWRSTSGKRGGRSLVFRLRLHGQAIARFRNASMTVVY